MAAREGPPTSSLQRKKRLTPSAADPAASTPPLLLLLEGLLEGAGAASVGLLSSLDALGSGRWWARWCCHPGDPLARGARSAQLRELSIIVAHL
jgi:hypothetical protein